MFTEAELRIILEALEVQFADRSFFICPSYSTLSHDLIDKVEGILKAQDNE